MQIGLIDVGSNTVRLLVASRKQGRVTALHQEKTWLGLGREIERHGHISPTKLTETAATVARQADSARDKGADPIGMIVTAPGRQSTNSARFVRALEDAAGAPARVLSAHEEALLAFRGATASLGCRAIGGPVCVCDVGGASTEIAVGEMGAAASWTYSADIGAVRLTERLFRGHEAPDEEALTGAEEEVERCFALVDPPTAAFALATGGTARAIRKLVGRTLGPEELAEARRLVVGRSAAELALHYGFDPGRARVLAAGVVVLAAVQRRIGVPLEVCREGLREGAMLAAFDELAAA